MNQWPFLMSASPASVMPSGGPVVLVVLSFEVQAVAEGQRVLAVALHHDLGGHVNAAAGPEPAAASVELLAGDGVGPIFGPLSTYVTRLSPARSPRGTRRIAAAIAFTVVFGAARHGPSATSSWSWSCPPPFAPAGTAAARAERDPTPPPRGRLSSASSCPPSSLSDAVRQERSTGVSRATSRTCASPVPGVAPKRPACVTPARVVTSSARPTRIWRVFR